MTDESTYNVHNGQTEIWLAYYSDRSGLAVFSLEISALRYAVEREMKVKRIETGRDIFEQVEER